MRNTRRRLEIADLTQVLGQIFIDRRQKLPDQRPYCWEAKKREQVIAATMLKQIRYDEAVLRLRDLDTFVAALIVDHEGPIPPDLRNGLLELAQARKSLLAKVTTTDTYLRALGDLDYASSLLIETITDDDYLATHILVIDRPLRQASTDRIEFTLKAIGSTLLLAALWLLLLVLLSWRLAASLAVTPFTKAIGYDALEVASPCVHCGPSAYCASRVAWQIGTFAGRARPCEPSGATSTG